MSTLMTRNEEFEAKRNSSPFRDLDLNIVTHFYKFLGMILTAVRTWCFTEEIVKDISFGIVCGSRVWRSSSKVPYGNYITVVRSLDIMC